MAKTKRRVAVTPTKKDYQYQLGIMTTTLIIMLIVALSSCTSSRHLGIDVTSEDSYLNSMSREQKLYANKFDKGWK